jgi:hypothetical protein
MDAVDRALASGDDLYALLGVEPDATDDEIRHAYRALARTHHPDVDPRGGDGFGRIAAAYEVLGSDRDRAVYDRALRLERMSEARAAAPGPVATHVAPRPSGSVGSRGRAASANPADHAPRAAVPVRPRREPVDEWRLVSVIGRVVAAAMAAIVIVIVVLMVVSAKASVPEPPPPTMWCKTPDGWHDCWSATSPDGP